MGLKYNEDTGEFEIGKRKPPSTDEVSFKIPRGNLPPGPKGEKGDRGETGLRGAKGDQGDKGEKGDPGKDGKSIAGSQGVPGKDGKAGKDGAPGKDGKSGMPAVGKDGISIEDIFQKNKDSFSVKLSNGIEKDFALPKGKNKTSGGAQGNQFFAANGAPGLGVGSYGDFYIDKAASMIYGPKGGTWGAGTVIGSVSVPVGRQIDSGATVTMIASDSIIQINKTVGSATEVDTAASPTLWKPYTIKDSKGDADVNPITIVPAVGTIDGASDYVINAPYGAVTFYWDGNNYNIQSVR